MAYNYVYIDGQRVEVNVAAAYNRLKAAFERAFPGLTLVISSGTRTRGEQQYLYNGWINRLPGFNLAAAPGYSNHEESGPTGPRAIDIRDTGSDAGVASRYTTRDLWMQANAPSYGFKNAGYDFRPVEAWHKEFTGSVGGTPAGSEEEDMTPEQNMMLKSLYESQIAFKDGKPQYGWSNAVANKFNELESLIKDTALRVRGSKDSPDYERADVLQLIREDIAKKVFAVDASAVKAIADAVVAQIGKGQNVSIDYAAIAKAVNDDAAKRLSS